MLLMHTVGTDSDKAEEARRILSERHVKYTIGSGDSAAFKDRSFPVVSEGGINYSGLEAIERHFSR